jgi:hypothetical protein
MIFLPLHLLKQWLCPSLTGLICPLCLTSTKFSQWGMSYHLMLAITMQRQTVISARCFTLPIGHTASWCDTNTATRSSISRPASSALVCMGTWHQWSVMVVPDYGVWITSWEGKMWAIFDDKHTHYMLRPVVELVTANRPSVGCR